MSPAASWALIIALLFLCFPYHTARYVRVVMDWALDHMGWTSPNTSPTFIGLWLVEGPLGSEWYVRVPEGHVRCPDCGYFMPEDHTDPITGICDECSDSEDTIDAEWRDLQRMLEDEKNEGEDHR